MIDLSKDNQNSFVTGLSETGIGLGWKQDMGTGGFDLDVSAFMLGKNKKLPRNECFVFYNNPQSPDGAVEFSGSGGDGDAKILHIDLAQIDSCIEEIVFAVSIYDCENQRRNFGQAKDSFIRIYNASNGEEMVRYDLSEDFADETAIEFGRLHRRGGHWGFEALGVGYGGGLQFFVNKYVPARTGYNDFPPPSLRKTKNIAKSEKKAVTESNTGTTHSAVTSLRVIELPGNVKLKLVKIKAGSFLMGSPENEVGRCDNEKQHQVTLTKDYWLGKYAVTQEQYTAVMRKNPSNYKGPTLPVEMVNWNDAMAFCRKLTELDGKLPLGYHYTLPTEAQWEYACRAGTITALNNCKNLTSETEICHNLDEVAWYDMNSAGKSHPVGKKRPNAWGLYDMHGNVLEMCMDYWNENYDCVTSLISHPDQHASGYFAYDVNSDYAATDPMGPKNGFTHVGRGGSWVDMARNCRSGNRSHGSPDDHYEFIGFRVALAPIQSTAASAQAPDRQPRSSSAQRQPEPPESESEAPNNLGCFLGGICLFFPFIGGIVFLMNIKRNPYKAISAGLCAISGIFFYIVRC